MPEIYVSDMTQPNAFATGRNPSNAKVSVTKGILQILDERELRAVLAHELSHVANRDILVSSVAAAIGTAISFLAYMAFWFGGSDDEGGNPLVMLVAWIFAPLAAAIIQMAVSRSREYQADESGAILSHDPDALASALLKLEQASKQVPAPASLKPAEAHLFIVNPLRARRPAGAELRDPVLHAPADRGARRAAEGDQAAAGLRRPSTQTRSSTDRRSPTTRCPSVQLTPSSGDASGRTSSTDPIPSAAAPSQYAAWSSTKIASSAPDPEGVERGPVDPGVGLRDAHLERQDDRVHLVGQAEPVDHRPRAVVAVADERRRHASTAELAHDGQRVVPQVHAGLQEASS